MHQPITMNRYRNQVFNTIVNDQLLLAFHLFI